MLPDLADLENFFGPLRLFRYLTFRCAASAATALFLGLLVAPWMLRKLRSFKQSFRDASEVGKLADLHAGKKNTPTMGGLIIFTAVTASSLLWARLNAFVIVALVVYSGLTFIGFMDDYLKVSKKNSKGLSSRWKLIGQTLLVFVSLSILLWNDSLAGTGHFEMLELWVPFVNHPVVSQMSLPVAFIFFFFVVAGSSNAINLTDGVDGLAIGCTITVALTYAVMAYVAGNAIISDYLFIGHVPGVGELAVICSALVGGGLAFLWYNAHPAEVFMGDTGSLALGGLIGAIAFMVHQPLTLILIGGIFVMEALSVIIQIVSFKSRGKRVFRMAPLHHHFELSGWHESKVVIRFWILSLIFALAGLSTLKLR